MIKHVYLILQQALASGVPAVKLIDMDFGQYNQKREDAVRTTPAIYIRLIDPVWQTMPKGIQRAVLTFTITLVSVTTFGDDRDITDVDTHAHMINHDLIYKTIQTKRYLLSTLQDFASIAGTSDDRQMIETITRKGTMMPDTLNNLLITKQTFEAVVYDYSASPAWTPVLAQLDLHVHLVKHLDQPVPPPDPEPEDKEWSYKGIMIIGTSNDDIPEIGYRYEGDEILFGFMEPSWEYANARGQSYLYYEAGSGYLYVSALVKEMFIGAQHFTESTAEYSGDSTTWFLDSSNPFEGLDEVEIKVLLHDMIFEQKNDQDLYDYFMSIIENEDLPYGYRKRNYQIFQDLFQDKDLFITEYINSNGFKVRRHITHMDREKTRNLEIAIFLCDTYGVNVDLLEKGNTPNRRYVDSRINDQVIVEFKGKETDYFSGGVEYQERDYNALRNARWQHQYSKHNQLPLYVLMENRGGILHGQFLMMMARYYEQHSYIKGIYVKTDDQCDLFEPAIINP